jgi:sugar phosphate isomerase/epimerase
MCRTSATNFISRMPTRRQFLHTLASVATMPALAVAANPASFRLRYILSSAMYGEIALADILPEVAKTGSDAIDIWCRVHGNQREQVDAMGDVAFGRLLGEHRVKLGVSTRYPLGPMALQSEMTWMKKFGGGVIVTGSKGVSEPSGAAAKSAVQDFLERMKPQIAVAEAHGITIAIENHDRQLLYHPDSLRYFAEFNQSPHLGVAFAPHHLHPWAVEIPALLRDLGGKQIPFMYFQEHSEGIRKKVSKEVELQQLPGFGGSLDYREILKALRDIGFAGYVEIFMHPTPRGIPILPTIPEITGAINRSRAHIETCLRQIER